MQKKGTKTMLMSVIMSAPGPLVLAIGLFMGRSNTQIADFIRRTIELIAILVSFVVYQITAKRELDKTAEKRLEKGANLFVGGTMCAAGAIMLCITLFMGSEEKGNVLFSLIIAILGVTANGIFWIRYTALGKREKNGILEVQARLYRAKTFVDLCVCIALISVLVAPMSAVSYYLDIIGSAVVSVYLAYSGVKIIIDKLKGYDA